MITGHGNWFFNRSEYSLDIDGLECRVTRKTSNIFQWIKSFFITPSTPDGFVKVELKNRSIVFVKADELSRQLGLSDETITKAADLNSVIIKAAHSMRSLRPTQREQIQNGDTTLEQLKSAKVVVKNIQMIANKEKKPDSYRGAKEDFDKKNATKLASFFDCDINTITEDNISLQAANKAYASCKKLDQVFADKLNVKSLIDGADLKTVVTRARKVTLCAFQCLEKNSDLSTVMNDDTIKVPCGIKQDDSGQQQLHLLAGPCLGHGSFGFVIETINLLEGELSGEAVKVGNGQYEHEGVAKEIMILKKLNVDDQTIGIQKKVHSFTYLNAGVAKREMHWGPKYECSLDNVSVVSDLSVGQQQKVALDLFHGVAYAHSKQITHGDIKPANILYNRSSEKAFLADWGGANDFTKPESCDAGACTPSYRTYEDSEQALQLYENVCQAKGEEAQKFMQHEKACDVLASCTTLIEIYLGEHPFYGEQPYKQGRDNLNKNLHIKLRVCGLSQGTINLIYQGLKKDPNERPSAVMILNALERDNKLRAP